MAVSRGRTAKRAAENLRKRLAELDGTAKQNYFLHLHQEIKTAGKAISSEEFLERCLKAKVIFVADYHAVPAYAEFAQKLIKKLHERGQSLVLGVEFVYSRQQNTLDLYQQEKVDAESFKRRIHYQEEWAYPWPPLENLLAEAKKASIKVYGLDAPPRRGTKSLRRRDAHAARRILHIMEDHPNATLIVFFGETHLANGHLPYAVRRRSKAAREPGAMLRIFQNPDRVHWSLVQEGRTLNQPIEVAPDAVAIFHTSPLEKYEAYRQVLEQWAETEVDPDDLDWTPAVHHILDSLAHGMGLKPHATVLRHQVGWVDHLEDVYPEVFTGEEAKEWLVRLGREANRTDDELTEASRRLEILGVHYESRANAFFIEHYRSGRTAAEAAKFIRVALTGRLFSKAIPFSDDPAERAYGAAFNEALAHFAARLVDPAMDLRMAAVANIEAIPGELSAEDAQWLALHAEFERGKARLPPRLLIEAMRQSRVLRRHIALEFGRRVGAKLYAQFRAGIWTPRKIRNLFAFEMEGPEAAPKLLGILRHRRLMENPEHPNLFDQLNA